MSILVQAGSDGNAQDANMQVTMKRKGAIMGFLRKLFGLEAEDVPEYSCKGYGSLDYGKTPQSTANTLKKRITIEADQIDQLIEHLKKVKRELVDLDIARASSVPVTAQNVIQAAKHAENLVKLKDDTVNCAKEMKYINSLVQYSGSRGFFGACAYNGHVALGPVDEQYYRDEKGKLRFDYYSYLLNTVYYFHILFQFKNLGYTIRINEKKHDFFVLNIPNPPEDLAVSSEYLDSYRDSSPIENFMESVKANAKALYDEFPELFTCQMRQEFGV